MSRLLTKSALWTAILASAVLSAHAQQPAAAQSTASGQSQSQSQTGSPAAVPAQPPVVSTTAQPLSQPGARGQLHAAAVPPVHVPPGPVAATGIKPAPPTPIAVQKVELHGDDPWNPEWDVLIEENLPPELLSSGVSRAVRPFCPRFNVLSNADKRAFWAYFFQALAGAEAGLKPTANVRHSDSEVAVIDPITHHVSRQEGLLQLKYQDSNRYGCNFDWQHDKGMAARDPGKSILDPGNNLLCGIHILRNQLVDLHRPLLTRKSYWATLRPRAPGYQNFVRQMANVPEACGQRPVQHSQRIDRRLDQALDQAFLRNQSADADQTSASFAPEP